MKKIVIILSVYLAFNTSSAISIDGFSLAVKKIFGQEKTTKVADFSLTDLAGKRYTNQSTKGKYLVVNFWATWCPPCIKEIPILVDFYERYQDQVLILGMDYEQANKDDIIEFSDTFLINYPVILFAGENANQFEKFGKILGLPTTYIYNPKGELVEVKTGEIDAEFLTKATNL